ncbi:MAG: serine hydrolase [Melioribacteraceae bacterium]|jgi:CubicO group peptidase (beta-lactamase class C family)|nr:MAG: serine hydrolase [Melioribacteraceae bacterium]
MRKIFFIISAIVLIIGIVELNAQEKAGTIDEFIQKTVEYNSFTGSALVADNQEVIFQKGYLFANREWNIPNDIDTKFRLGSITKQFTAAVILKLREEGKLKLEDKITDHIPYYRKDTGEKVSIHQLLIHTSGIPSYTSHPDFFGKDSKRDYTVEEFVKQYCMGDFDFEPGADWAYNNSGYYLLGVIIEEITGMTYAEALHHYILDPLNMKETGFDKYEEIISKRADGYSFLFIEYTNAPYINMELPYAAGSMYSTVGDLFKWDQALYQPGLLTQESLDLMFTPHVAAMGGHYGYGWSIVEKDIDGDDEVEKIISHGGGINGFNTLISRIPEKGQLIVLLNNTGGAPLGFMSNQIYNIINGLDFEYPKKGIALAVYQKYVDEGIDEALNYYSKLKESDQLDLFYRDRAEFNSLGYYLMNTKNDLSAALKVFELNMNEYSDWYNAYDSYAEALMKTGNNEKAIEYYKKSVDMNPGNQNGIEKLKELGVEYKKEITVGEDILNEYVGKYELAPNFILTIRHEAGQLYTQATGQPEFEVYPSSETEFYLTVVDAQIKFNRNNEGKVESLTLFQGGREMPAKKIQ